MLSIIVPAYNEAKNLDRTIEKTVETLEKGDLQYEVIVVNDGSEDGSYEKALSLTGRYPNVRAFGYAENMGKGYALKYGFQFVRGDLVLFMDADSDLPPSQIPLFLSYMEKGDADVVIGSKRHPLSKVKFPLSRTLWSKGYSLLIRVLFNLKISDTQVGMKLFQRKVLEQVFPKVMVNRYAGDVELLANAHRLGYSIVEAPVELNYQTFSRISLKDIWCMFVDTMAIFYRMKILRHYGSK